MRRFKIILGIALLALVTATGWQIGAWEIANASLQEEMRDMASQSGTHIGLVAPPSDDDLNAAVVRKAKEHGIDLAPAQVTVRRINPGEKSTLSLAADYTVPVNLLLFSFHLHFAPSSDPR